MTPAFVYPRAAYVVETRAGRFTFHRVAEPLPIGTPHISLVDRVVVQ